MTQPITWTGLVENNPTAPVLTRVDNTHVLVTPSERIYLPGCDRPAHYEPEAPLWEGPECQMCNGSGTARFIHGGGTETFARCPACNGHGREAS